MSLVGTGAICIWNDIAPKARDDFYAWHLDEHFAERLALPGFLRARRCSRATTSTGPEFFTLYETATPAVTTSAAYLARLNAPSAWTTRLTPAFSNTSRALTEVAESHGVGSGGAVVTIRLLFASAAEQAAVVTRCAVALPAAVASPQITGAHLCLTDRDGSTLSTTESRARIDLTAAPDGVVLIEACTVAAAEAVAHPLVQGALGSLAVAPVVDLYRLEHMRVAGAA